jgi:hypothetical protein
MALTCKVLFLSIPTFETLPEDVAGDILPRAIDPLEADAAIVIVPPLVDFERAPTTATGEIVVGLLVTVYPLLPDVVRFSRGGTEAPKHRGGDHHREGQHYG